MKSLQAKLTTMISLMLLISLILAGLLVYGAMQEGEEAELYEVRDEIAGHMNGAAAWQAIERGVGATILGSDNPPSSLIAKFDDLGKKGDSEVSKGFEHAEELLVMHPDPDLEAKISAWKSAYDALKAARPRVKSGSIKKDEWIPIASRNIAAEFAVRNVVFSPMSPTERVIIYNSVVRANVATLAEYAGRERAQLGGAIGGHAPVPTDTLATLKNYRAIVDNASENILSLKDLASTPPSLAQAIREYEDEFLGSYQQLREEIYKVNSELTVKRYRSGGQPEPDDPQYPVSGPEWIARATKAINTALAISNVIGDLSEEAVANAKSHARMSEIREFILLLAAVAVFIFVFLFVRRAVVKPIHRIIEDLSEGSNQIASASSEISSSSQQLAEGATEQASSLEETSSALEEMAAQTRQNADNANNANNLASEARTNAEKGNTTMDQMISAMADINKSSDEISKIIKVIEEIAFQTNLLALNAAVEAARAGEHGKGFAVVAEEVRNLAQRSATAAKDTAQLIETAVKNAQEGGEMADQAGNVLKEIVGNVKSVTDIIGEIASASNQQAQGIDQVNTAVSQMDKVTQQNAANAEESAAASEELNAQAEALNGLVIDLNTLISGEEEAAGAHGKPANKPRQARKPALPAPKGHAPAKQAKKPAPKPDAPKGGGSRKKHNDVIPLDDDDFADF